LKVAFINPLYGTIQFVPWVTNRDVIAVIPWLLIAGAVVAVVASMAGMRRFLDV
jgi:cell division protein FtsX